MSLSNTARLIAASVLCGVLMVGAINQDGQPQPGADVIPPVIVQLLNGIDNSPQKKNKRDAKPRR
ncbi:MAG: hypothetical protein F6J86_28985 [Symploca sp. SIO1B1]|nr:hypothetical protein [Symploca sp. SIO1B1]